MSTTYRLPQTFVNDHIDRDLLDRSVVTKENRRFITAELTDAQFSELLSDARYYAFEIAGFGWDNPATVSAAKRLVIRLEETPTHARLSENSE